MYTIGEYEVANVKWMNELNYVHWLKTQCLCVHVSPLLYGRFVNAFKWMLIDTLSIDLIEMKDRNNCLLHWNQANHSSTNLNGCDFIWYGVLFTDCSVDEVEIREIIISH